MPLDYEYTCPKIDDAIEDSKTEIHSHIEDLLHRFDLPLEEFNEILKDAAGCLSDVIADLIEELRTTNEKMRDAADKQIENLNDELAISYDEKHELEEQVNSLQVERDEAESEAEEYRGMYEELL